MSEIFNVLKERCSCRAYKDEAISQDQLNSILEAGLLAPTAANMQELHFTVVDNKSELVAEIASDLNPDAKVPFHYNSSKLIVVSGKEEFPWTPVDAGIAVENMHLAAAGLGLGSVIIGCIAGVLTGEKKAYYNEKLCVPEGYAYQVALAVGVPAAEGKHHDYDCEKLVSIL